MKKTMQTPSKPPMKAGKPAMPMAPMPMKRGGSVKGKSPMADFASKNPMAFSAK